MKRWQSTPIRGLYIRPEDRDDGLIYRYIPEKRGELLMGGRLAGTGNTGSGSCGYQKLG